MKDLKVLKAKHRPEGAPTDLPLQRLRWWRLLFLGLLLPWGCDSGGLTGPDTDESPPQPPSVLFLRPGDPSIWTVQGGGGSVYEEIQRWTAAGYTVTTMDRNSVTISAALLKEYTALRSYYYSASTHEASAIHEWVVNGGHLLADVSRATHTSSVRHFGVETIEGRHGGSSGLDWTYHGAPLLIGPVLGPVSQVNSLAAESMDRPVLSPDHTLSIGATKAGYPAIVHGEFGAGKVVIVFAQSWSHDKTRKPSNAYRASIFQANNTQFLENCIQYFSE